MTENEVPRNILFLDPKEYFLRNGTAAMRLAPKAAIGVCEMAAEQGLLVGMVEGGRWKNPGFGARLDCIWHSKFCPPSDIENAIRSNKQAAAFVCEESVLHDVFIITTLPL